MTLNEISQAYFDYDLIVTGSYHVWNPDVTAGFDKVYFLTFDGSFRRTGYAISLVDVDNDWFAEKLFLTTPGDPMLCYSDNRMRRLWSAKKLDKKLPLIVKWSCNSGGRKESIVMDLW